MISLRSFAHVRRVPPWREKEEGTEGEKFLESAKVSRVTDIYSIDLSAVPPNP
jgi:hypothetical protein